MERDTGSRPLDGQPLDGDHPGVEIEVPPEHDVQPLDLHQRQARVLRGCAVHRDAAQLQPRREPLHDLDPLDEDVLADELTQALVQDAPTQLLSRGRGQPPQRSGDADPRQDRDEQRPAEQSPQKPRLARLVVHLQHRGL